jgi:hypothetical protein
MTLRSLADENKQARSWWFSGRHQIVLAEFADRSCLNNKLTIIRSKIAVITPGVYAFSYTVQLIWPIILSISKTIQSHMNRGGDVGFLCTSDHQYNRLNKIKNMFIIKKPVLGFDETRLQINLAGAYTSHNFPTYSSTA